MIPWIPAKPPVPIPAAVAARCRLSQLEVGPSDPKLGVFYNGETGSLAGAIVFRNLGKPCALSGRPGLQLMDSAEAVPTRQEILAESQAADDLTPPFSTRALPHGKAAIVTVVWSNWCGRGVTGVRVTLPSGGGSATLPILGHPRCDQASSGTFVTVGAFRPFVPEPKPSTRLPLSVRFDRSSYVARRGAILDYVMTLRNTSKKPFRFARCPVYVESVGSARETYVLNCHPVGVLAPGETAKFAMQFRVPSTLRIGRLLWVEVGLGTANPPNGSVPVTLTG